jgi:hypothetical protein
MESATPHNLSEVPLEHGRDIRARAWAFVFECYRKKQATTSLVSRPDDGTNIKEDSANVSSLPN